MNTLQKWKAETSLLHEAYGKQPEYPLATVKYIADYSVQEINHNLQRASDDMRDAIIETSQQISGSIENGFNKIIEANINGFNSITNKLDDIGEILGWGFENIVQQQKVTNLLLENIIELLKIPDSQKQRQYYIAQGLKFFSNARYDAHLYDNALENLLNAKKIENTDYFLLHKLGLIYLYSPKHLNLQKAIAYFEKSAKYAKVETYANSIKSQNTLKKDFLVDSNTITKESYYFLAKALYLSGKVVEAYRIALKALEYDKEDDKIYFDIAIYSSALNKKKEMLYALKKSIDINPINAHKALFKVELYSRKSVLHLLKQITQEKRNYLNNLLKDIKQFLVIDDSPLKDEIIKLRTYIRNNNFFDILKAIEILESTVEPDKMEIYKDYKDLLIKIKVNSLIPELQELLGNLLTLSPKNYGDLLKFNYTYKIKPKLDYLIPLYEDLLNVNSDYYKNKSSISCWLIYFIFPVILSTFLLSSLTLQIVALVIIIIIGASINNFFDNINKCLFSTGKCRRLKNKKLGVENKILNVENKILSFLNKIDINNKS